jgi:hypothetical protein
MLNAKEGLMILLIERVIQAEIPNKHIPVR